jgi:hypothetical protein
MNDARLAVPRVGRPTRVESSRWDDGPAGIRRLFGYARVYSDDVPGNAFLAKTLSAAGCSRIFLDTTSVADGAALNWIDCSTVFVRATSS